MIVVNHFIADDPDFPGKLETALVTLAQRSGYLGGSAGRSTDDVADWVLVTEWRNVGAYRRALGNYDVKMHATPVLAQAIDQASAFEQLVVVAPDGSVTRADSDRADEPTGRTPW